MGELTVIFNLQITREQMVAIKHSMIYTLQYVWMPIECRCHVPAGNKCDSLFHGGNLVRDYLRLCSCVVVVLQRIKTNPTKYLSVFSAAKLLHNFSL